MRRIATFVCLLLCSALTAQAAGLNLSWDHCYADGSPVSNKSFACISNAGEESLVGSFVSPLAYPGMVRMNAALEIQAATTSAFPAWLLAGGCAEAALQIGGYTLGTDLNCRDWTGTIGAPVSITSYVYPAGNSGRELLQIASADISFPGSTVQANVEYLAFRLRISHNALAGPGACGGCSMPLTIALTNITVSGGPGAFTLILPVSGTSNQVHWQPSGGPTAARTTTWSAVKSLYR